MITIKEIGIGVIETTISKIEIEEIIGVIEKGTMIGMTEMTGVIEIGIITIITVTTISIIMRIIKGKWEGKGILMIITGRIVLMMEVEVGEGEEVEEAGVAAEEEDSVITIITTSNQETMTASITIIKKMRIKAKITSTQIIRISKRPPMNID